MDTQRIHNLIEYLEELHDHHKATSDHTTLLLNCYAKLKDVEKLEEFIKYKQGNIAEDKDGHLVYLAQSEWFLNTERQNNPDIQFHFTSEIHK